MIFSRNRSTILFLITFTCVWIITGCSLTASVGLYPEYPPLVRKRLSLLTDFVEVDQLTPNFRWQPLDMDRFDPLHMPENITYELRVWRTVPNENGKLVYVRNRLVETVHQMELPLEPGTRYLWSVRAHFTIDGNHRTTEWTMAGYTLRNESVPNDSCLRFITPSKERNK